MLVISLIAARAVDQVLYYRIATVLDGYGLWFSAVVLPVGFLVVLWPIVIYRIWTGTVTKEMLAFPRSKFIALGVLDTLYNVLSTWPVPSIGGPVSNVLSQAVVPINLVLSGVVLRTGFSRLHYAGAFLAVYGVLVRLIPSFLGADGDAAGSATGVAFVFWCVVMMASQVPAALSNVYKEAALKGAERLDVWYANVVISTWQLGFGILIVPLSGLPFSPDHVDLANLPQYVADATGCFLGTSVRAGDACEDEAVSALALFCVFLVFNVSYNLLSLAVMQEGSSALFVVASAVRLPLVDILLLWPWLAGLATASFTIYDGFALAALLLAIYLYNADPERPGEAPPRTLCELVRAIPGLCCCSCVPRGTVRAACAAIRGGGAGGGRASRGEAQKLVASDLSGLDDVTTAGDDDAPIAGSGGFYGSGAAAAEGSVSGLSLAAMDVDDPEVTSRRPAGLADLAAV